MQKGWTGKMKIKFKRGIAMVELIFALVIMGIVLLSAPMLIQQSIQSSNVALQQEAIASLASHTGLLLSKHWDEGDTNLSAGVAPILTLNNPAINSPFNFNGIDFENNVSGRTRTVAGQVFNNSLAMGQDTGDFDDIDDYDNFPITVALYETEVSTTGGLGDYVDENITINTTVTYADDRPTDPFNQTVINAGNNIFGTQDLAGNTTSNIKFIQTRLTTTHAATELDKNITLNSFSCNLGTYSLGDRQY